MPASYTDLERGQQLHPDFLMKDLAAAAEHALSLGAVDPPARLRKNWHLLLDPAGHPFCP